uniref:Zn(2)-C6 fungal-type domain-containing protein n=1 Tax=Mycena chlorophos TaxID=658473 RepID=A0ABQ0KY39_MYCCL|nr:predicted protein [Mycena chlorophos]
MSNVQAQLVCLTCRTNNIKCIPSPQAPAIACQRCARKGLPCQYVAVPSSPTTSSSSIQGPGPGKRLRPILPAPAQPAPLPYTGPPPAHRPPRYSGSAYPNLALGGGEESSHPSGHVQGYATMPYYEHQPVASSSHGYPAPAGYPPQPDSQYYAAGSYGYPQMSYGSGYP